MWRGANFDPACSAVSFVGSWAIDIATSQHFGRVRSLSLCAVRLLKLVQPCGQSLRSISSTVWGLLPVYIYIYIDIFISILDDRFMLFLYVAIIVLLGRQRWKSH